MHDRIVSSRGPERLYRSQSLQRGAAISECFSGGRSALEVFELADIAGATRSRTHRYALTPVALGHLEQGSQSRYRLSSGAARPGMVAPGGIRQELSAWDVLERLRDDVGFTVSMGVLDRARVVYLYRFFGHGSVQYLIDQDLGVGAEVPVYCTALGKALLASLPAGERRRVVASLQLVPYGPRSITTKTELVAELDRIGGGDTVVSNEELVGGARSVAVLLPHSGGEHPLAIEVTVPAETRTVNRLVREFGPLLRLTARQIVRP
jgi:IclR family pca regulon transcriptional regulator